jgi:hypothetical protein
MSLDSNISSIYSDQAGLFTIRCTKYSLMFEHLTVFMQFKCLIQHVQSCMLRFDTLSDLSDMYSHQAFYLPYEDDLSAVLAKVSELFDHPIKRNLSEGVRVDTVVTRQPHMVSHFLIS